MTVTIHRDHDELTDNEFEKLRESVLKARELAYCPYSKFRVGCTLITTTGESFTGANIENASYPGGICAERTAICKAVLDGYRDFKVIAIAGDAAEPITPCGICRQFIREFSPKVPIYMFSDTQFMKVYFDELLPLSFGPEHLT